MANALVIAASCLLFFGGIIALEQIIRPRIYKYRFDTGGLSVVLFNRFLWRHLPYREVLDVDVLPWYDLLSPGPGLHAFRERLWNTRRLFRTMVALRRPNRHVIYVTPENPDAFIDELLTHLEWASTHPTTQRSKAPRSEG